MARQSISGGYRKKSKLTLRTSNYEQGERTINTEESLQSMCVCVFFSNSKKETYECRLVVKKTCA